MSSIDKNNYEGLFELNESYLMSFKFQNIHNKLGQIINKSLKDLFQYFCYLLEYPLIKYGIHIFGQE